MGAEIISWNHPCFRGVQAVGESQLCSDGKAGDSGATRRLRYLTVKGRSSFGPAAVVVLRVVPINPEVLSIGIIPPGSITETKQRGFHLQRNSVSGEGISIGIKDGIWLNGDRIISPGRPGTIGGDDDVGAITVNETAHCKFSAARGQVNVKILSIEGGRIKRLGKVHHEIAS